MITTEMPCKITDAQKITGYFREGMDHRRQC